MAQFLLLVCIYTVYEIERGDKNSPVIECNEYVVVDFILYSQIIHTIGLKPLGHNDPGPP